MFQKDLPGQPKSNNSWSSEPPRRRVDPPFDKQVIEKGALQQPLPSDIVLDRNTLRTSALKGVPRETSRPPYQKVKVMKNLFNRSRSNARHSASKRRTNLQIEHMEDRRVMMAAGMFTTMPNNQGTVYDPGTSPGNAPPESQATFSLNSTTKTLSITSLDGYDDDVKISINNRSTKLTSDDLVRVSVKNVGDLLVQEFPLSSINYVSFQGLGGADRFDNRTAVKSIAYGGLGNDTLLGGSGTDQFFGGDGFDYLDGRLGDDLLYGNGQQDRLFGDAGQDVLFGGDDLDMLYGDSETTSSGANKETTGSTVEPARMKCTAASGPINFTTSPLPRRRYLKDLPTT